MSYTLSKSSIHTLHFSTDTHEFAVDVPSHFAPDSGVLFAHELESGDTRVAWLCHDDDHHDFEFGEGVWSGIFEEYPNAQYQEYEEQTRADFLMNLYGDNPGRVFIVHKDSRGGMNNAWSERFEPFGHADPDDEEWFVDDSFSFGDGVHVIPDDVADPQAFSTCVWEEWTKWANGDVYGIVCRTYDQLGEEVDDGEMSECWGFIGSDYAEEECRRVAEQGW